MSNSIERWSKTLESNPANHLARFSLAKAYFDGEQFEEARHHLGIALEARPDWMLVQILLGKTELALGNKQDAINHFRQALKLAIDQRHEGPQMELESLLDDLKSDS